MARPRLPRAVLSAAAAGAAIGSLLGGLGFGPVAGPASARSAVVQQRITYQEGPHRLWMEEFRPAGSRASLPAVLVIHGGGWSQGRPEGFSGPAAALARRGLAAFDVDYTLDGPRQAGQPVQLDELVAAARTLETRARPLGLAPGRLGLLGSSAGGHLADLLALDRAAPPVQAVVSWSAPVSMLALARAPTPAWLRTDAIDYVGCAPRRCPERWSEASPLSHVAAGVRPGTHWLAFNSQAEIIPVAGAEAMATALGRAGADERLVIYPGARHAGQYQGLALGPSVDFLVRWLGSSPTNSPSASRKAPFRPNFTQSA